MTDSVDRKPEENTNEAILARMDQYGRREPRERLEFSDLPTWVRTAAALKYLLGLSWKDAAERVGKKAGSVRSYKASPAFTAWRYELEEASKDPKAMAELVLKAHALGVSLDYLAAFQKAVEANDYKEVGAQARDLLDRIGIQKKDSRRNAPAQLHITIAGGGSIDVPVVEAEWEEIEESKQMPSG